LNGNVYWPLGFPTINVIRPGDREITADIWNQNLNQMINTVNAAIESNPQSIGSDWLVENGISVYPNPTAGDLNVTSWNCRCTCDGIDSPQHAWPGIVKSVSN
jgi:hypothetical protein